MNIHIQSRRLICPFRTQILFALVGLLLTGTPASAAQVDLSGNEGMAHRLFAEVLTSGDLVAAGGLISEDAAIHTPEGEFRGPEGMGEFTTILHGSFPNASFVVQELIAAADTVSVRWSMTGTHHGEYQGIAATCSAVAIDGLSIIRAENFLVAEQWIQYDRRALSDQIDAGAQPSCSQDAIPADVPSCDGECLKPGGNR